MGSSGETVIESLIILGSFFNTVLKSFNMQVLFIVSEKAYWAEELFEPLELIREDHDVSLATPTGKEPEPDPASIEDDEDAIENDPVLPDPIPVMEAYRSRDQYDALVLPGGHGTLWDINQDVHVQKLVQTMVDKAGVLAICHAVGVLGFVPDVVHGKKVTGFPNEWEDDQVDANEVRGGEKLPYRVQDMVIAAGGDWDAELDDAVSVTLDGGLVTARGPDSSKRGAEQFLKVLEKAEDDH